MTESELGLHRQIAEMSARIADQESMASMVASLHQLVSAQKAQAPPPQPAAAANHHTVASLSKLYLASIEFKKLKVTDTEEGRLRLNILRLLGDVKICDLTYQHIDAYRDQRRGEKYGKRKKTTAPATRNHEVKRLRRICAWGVMRKEIPFNPLLGIAMEAEDNKRRTMPTPEQLQALMRHCDLRGQAMFATAFWGGFRRAELCKIKLSQVNWDEGLIVLDMWDTKTKKGRTTVFPCRASALVRAYLDERERKGIISEYLFCTGKGGPVHPRNLLYVYQRAWEQAGLQTANNEAPWLHDLRAGFVGFHIEHGTSDNVIMKMTGHSTHEAFDRYARVQKKWLEHARVTAEDYQLIGKTGRRSAKRSPVEASARRRGATSNDAMSNFAAQNR